MFLPLNELQKHTLIQRCVQMYVVLLKNSRQMIRRLCAALQRLGPQTWMRHALHYTEREAQTIKID